MKLSSIRKFALSLPEATEQPHFDYSSYRVRGKIFATVPPAGGFLHVFVPEELRERMAAAHPEFIEKLTWGQKVVGVRVTLAQADAAVVKALVLAAWRSKAPKALHAQAPT